VSFQPDPRAIRWRVHLRAAPPRVFDMLATDDGRRRFWAESAEERDGCIHFQFADGTRWAGRVLEREPPERFAIEYFGDLRVTFACAPDGRGGTDLTLTEVGTPAAEREESLAGWVSVLLALKAAVDHDVDLRNHDARRSWAHGYVDN
jgi:uncharacterized protein YndB with AHSA1/START domain